jgi:hypothetical protein
MERIDKNSKIPAKNFLFFFTDSSFNFRYHKLYNKYAERFQTLFMLLELNLAYFSCCQLPIKADSHFFLPILLKLAGNVKNGKNIIPHFLFFFKMKNNEDIRD